jgi:hypothetical protein
VNLHAHLQQKRNPRWSACSEKKDRKNLPTCSNDMNPKPTRHTIFAKFSREFRTIRLAEMSVSLWRKCDFFRKTLFLRAQ